MTGLIISKLYKIMFKKFLILFTFSIFLISVFPVTTDAQVLHELKNKFDNAIGKSNDLDRKIVEYDRQISSLENNITTLEQNIVAMDLEIKFMQASIDKTIWSVSDLQNDIQKLEVEIKELEHQIENQKELLGKMVRLLYGESKSSQQDLVYVLLSSENINDAFNRMEYLSIIEKEAYKIYSSLKSNQKILDEHNKYLENEQKRKKRLLYDLENQRGSIEDQKAGKEQMISLTEGKQSLYENLRIKAEEQRKKVDDEISNITSQILIEKDRIEKLRKTTSKQGFKWPIDPSPVTAGFRDPGYAKMFGRQHNGVDFRAAVGTDIRSPKDGIVTKIVYPTSKKLSYLIIDHGGIQTVYLHLSELNVVLDQEVTQGQVVAKTGGAPGANGTGVGLSTGPHLHFEVREAGTPVNPLGYLP